MMYPSLMPIITTLAVQCVCISLAQEKVVQQGYFARLDTDLFMEFNATITPCALFSSCAVKCVQTNCTTVGYIREKSMCYLGGVTLQQSKVSINDTSTLEDMHIWYSMEVVSERHESIRIVGSTESSVYREWSTASKLYDGITDGAVFLDTNEEFEPWARLYFASPSVVKSLIVWNRNDGSSTRDRSYGLEFRVARSVAALPDDKSLCAFFQPLIDMVQPINCSSSILGLLLEIKVKNRIDYFNLHEVAVFGAAL